MENNTLHDLVKKAISLDKKAFIELCNIKSRDVLYICIKRMGNRQDGEDAAQEVFIRMQKSIGSLQNPDAFSVWLNRIITTTCQNQHRRLVHKSPPMDIAEVADMLQENRMDFLPPEYAEEHDKRKLVLESIEALPARYRDVIYLYYYEELRLEEIAQVLSISHSAADHRLRRARKTIRSYVERTGAHLPAAVPLAGLPVLGRILQQEALQLVSDQMARQAVAGIGTSIAAGGIGTGVVAAAATLQTTAGSAVAVGSIIATCATLTIAGGWLAVSTLSGTSPTAGDAAAVSFQAPASLYAQAPQPAEHSYDIWEPAQSQGESLVLYESFPLSTSLASSSLASSSVAPSSQAAAAQQEADILLTGHLLLRGLAGEDGSFVSGVAVLLVQNGRVVATTTTSESGKYSLTAPSHGAYTIQAGTPPAGLQYAGDSTLAVLLEAGCTVAQLPSIYLVDPHPPTGYIRLDAPADTLAAPQGASIVLADATPLAVAWEVWAHDSTAPLLSGAGQDTGAAFGSLPTSADGVWYTVLFHATDLCGNTASFQHDFILFDAPI